LQTLKWFFLLTSLLTLLYYVAYTSYDTTVMFNSIMILCVYMNEERDPSQADELTVENTKSSASKSLSTTV